MPSKVQTGIRLALREKSQLLRWLLDTKTYSINLLRKRVRVTTAVTRVQGPWGTPPGQHFLYVHLNRGNKKYDFDMTHVASPGHFGPSA